ncbi:MAG: hypothetical protein ACOX4D_03135 [Bacteroidales bacterium]
MKNYRFLFIISFLSFIFSINFSNAQEIEVSSTIDKQEFLIGEQANLKLNVKADINLKIIWPNLTDTTFQKIEIVKVSKIDTLLQGNNNIYNQTITITCFDSGYYAIPAFNFLVKDGDVFSTKPFLIEVSSVAVDTTNTIKPIVGPLKQKITIKEIFSIIWKVLLGLLVLFLIVFGIIKIIKNKKKKESDPKEVIKHQDVKEIIPPNIKAINSLQNITLSDENNKEELKEYYESVTNILRLYISEVFKINAVEMSTYDIFAVLHDNPNLLKESYSLGYSIFELSDLVKFAKYYPDSNQNVQIVEDAVHFVNISWDFINNLKESGDDK